MFLFPVKLDTQVVANQKFGWLQVELDSIIQKFMEIDQSWFALLEDKLVAGEISHSGFWHYLQASSTIVIKSEL